MLERLISRKKRAGQNPARLEYSQIKLEIVRYLLVAGNEGGTAFVPAGGGVLVSSAGLQPVSIIPTTRPSNTIRVDILFIGTRNFYQNQGSDKQKYLIIINLRVLNLEERRRPVHVAQSGTQVALCCSAGVAQIAIGQASGKFDGH